MAEEYDTIYFICNANYKQVQTLLGSKTTWLALGGWKAFQACFWLIHRRPTCLWTIWLHSLGYFLAMVDITFWICFFLHSSHGGGQIPLRISGAIPKKNKIWKLYKLTSKKGQINCSNLLTKILQFYFEYFSTHLGLRNFPGNTWVLIIKALEIRYIREWAISACMSPN